MTYEDYMQFNIWNLAGMSNTSLEHYSKEYKNKTKLYLKIKDQFIKSPHNDLSIIHAAGGIQSNAEDLLKFGKAILENKLIKRETLELMFTTSNNLAQQVGDDPYGLGWSVLIDPELGRIIQHGGSQPGASSFFTIYLDQNSVFITLSNSFGSKQNTYQLTKQLGNLTHQSYASLYPRMLP